MLLVAWTLICKDLDERLDLPILKDDMQPPKHAIHVNNFLSCKALRLHVSQLTHACSLHVYIHIFMYVLVELHVVGGLQRRAFILLGCCYAVQISGGQGHGISCMLRMLLLVPCYRIASDGSGT